MIDRNIGFIGLGNVGSKLASNILHAGHNLFIFDIDENTSNELVSKGAIWKNSVKDIIDNTSLIITYINDKHLWIEMSTTDEKEMIRLSKLIESKGANVLEAPVTGGQHRAESGNISVLTAGKRENFDRAFPILSEIGFQVLYCGKLGNASTLKVVTNYLASINLLSIGEALMVCKKYGIDLGKAYQGIKISSGNSFVHETESQVILNGSYDVGFTMDLVCKDVGLFDQLTNNLNIPAEISPLMVKIFNEGRKTYGDRAFSTKIVKLLEEKCNTDLRTEGFPSQLLDKEPRKKGIEIKP
jgi:3-hydroxyisobutyrate dehydrogenase